MPGIRTILLVLAFLSIVAPLHAGNFFPQRKTKLDANRIRVLWDLLRKEPNPRKRLAVVAELKGADPRAYPDATLALVSALRRDSSPLVRRSAAEAIGQMKVMVPLAGVALETAAETDPAPDVRDAAQQALWEYHLIGYRSARGADGIAGQSTEPPRARPARPRAFVVTTEPVSRPRSPVQIKAVAPLPPKPQPRSSLKYEEKKGVRVVVSAAPPALLNLTSEPPLAYAQTPPATLDVSISNMGLPPVSLAPDAKIVAMPLVPQEWTPPRVYPITTRLSIPHIER